MARSGWKRHLLWEGVVAVAIAVWLAGDLAPSGVAFAAEITACTVGDMAPRATVAAVLDGDTVRLDDGRVVKLAGIEAPRRPLAAPEAEPWPLSAAARDGLERLVAGQPVAVVLVADEPDRHGRWNANLFVGEENEWLQGLMVAAGWARVHWLPSDSACVFALLDQEKAARAANLGLWNSPEYAVREARDPSLIGRNGLYELVEGRVQSVGHGTYMIFLDFGRDYRRDFTVMVSPPVAEGLSQADRPVDRFKDRRVRVRGVIEESGGPAIRLNDPGEIEVLDDGED
jgi:endonuclease YncB( thermonuclease family)